MKIVTVILIILSVLMICFCTLNDKGYIDGLFYGYKVGYKAGIQAQIDDNIAHWVMDENGWLNEFKLAR